MVERKHITFPAKTGAERRTAYIYLPRSYEQEERRFPVLYMFDGHNVFFDSDATYGKSWGMGEYLDEIDAPLIVAAIECNHDADNGRLKEYAPYPFTFGDGGQLPGYGDATMQWMIHTFKAEVDRHYRTLPDREHTWIAGSSMGGLMSLYAVLRYNDVYSRAAALSPSVWANRQKLLGLANGAALDRNTVVYMDYGSEEFGNHVGMRAAFGDMAAALIKRGLLVNARVVPGGTHCEASWERQLPFVIGTLLYDVEEEGEER